VNDTTLVDTFNKNLMVTQQKVEDSRSAPLKMEFGHKQKMTVGVRREPGDADGNKYISSTQIDNKEIFKEPVSGKDGRMANFNLAAGVEH
jgi:hypothetical protein